MPTHRGLPLVGLPKPTLYRELAALGSLVLIPVQLPVPALRTAIRNRTEYAKANSIGQDSVNEILAIMEEPQHVVS